MTDRGYHHGDLPDTLRAAALDVLANDGPAKLSLRQVAAQAGVSHNAPRHHFPDKRALLTDLALAGFTLLADAMRTSQHAVAISHDDPSPARQAAAMLGAYVRMHQDHPGHAAIMWRTDLLDPSDTRPVQASLDAFTLLKQAVDASQPSTTDPDTTYRLALMLWSLAHGATQLGDRLSPQLAPRLPDTSPADLPPADQLVEEFTHRTLTTASR